LYLLHFVAPHVAPKRVGWSRCGHDRERKRANRRAIFFKVTVVKLLRLFE
jgi:hypothetical protein